MGRDVDRASRAVVVHRRFADGVLTPFPKTEPFASAPSRSRPGRLRRVIRHSRRPDSHGADRMRCATLFATEALAARVSTFELARLPGAPFLRP